MSIVKRRDTAETDAASDGDQCGLISDSSGRLHVNMGSGPTAGVKDGGPGWTTTLGVAGVAFTSADATTAAAVTDAPTTGKKLVITDLIVSTDTAMFLLFHEQDSASNLYFKVFVPANGTVQITPRSKIKLHTINKKLMVDASAAGNIAVTATYYSED